MKTRTCFVSNSSSSSFLVFTQDKKDIEKMHRLHKKSDYETNCIQIRRTEIKHGKAVNWEVDSETNQSTEFDAFMLELVKAGKAKMTGYA